MNYKHRKDPSYEKVHPDIIHPGTIDNSMFYIDSTSYVRTKEDMRSELLLRNPQPFEDSKKWVKKLNKETWEFFSKKYGGGPPFYIENKDDDESILKLFPIKIEFYVLPKRTQFTNKDKLFNINNAYVTYVNCTKNAKDIMAYLEQVIDDNELITKLDAMLPIAEDNTNDNSSETPQQRFRFWVPGDALPSLHKFKQTFIRYADKISTTSELLEPNETFNIIDIKYSSIGKGVSSYTEIPICHTIIIEQSPFIFSESNIEFGNCQFCNRRTYLRCSCECKAAHYCRKECFERDRFHKSKCIISIMSSIEDEMNVPQSEQSLNGLVGLCNIGNTCFMNTSLQCLSNCYELTSYFLNDHFKPHINKDNPIGSKGVLAMNYAALIKHLWYGSESTYNPGMFKDALGNYQRMFIGSRQHDTTEFLNYLLDGLHEDLNKVLKKPTIQRNDDTNSVTDAVASTNAWIDFLRRNQSVLVDIFYGQFKSTVKCPDTSCKNISISFEPFMTLSLPMTIKVSKYQVTCYYIYFDLRIKPIQLNLYMYNKTNIMALRNKVAELLNVHPMSFYVETFENFKKIKEFCGLNYVLEKKAQSYLREDIEYFFLFEIDPHVFYSKYNTHISEDEHTKANDNSVDISALTDIDSYNEKFNYVNSHSYVNKSEYNEDVNNDHLGLDEEKVVRVVTKNFDSNAEVEYKLPRTLLLPLKMNSVDLYKYMFKYYINVIVRSMYKDTNDINVYLSNSNAQRHEAIDKLYNELFKDLINNNDEMDVSSITTIPFRIFIHKKVNSYKHKTYFIPYNKSTSIQTLVNVYKENRMKFNNMKLYIAWNAKYRHCIDKLTESSNPLGQDETTSQDKELTIYDCFDNFISEETLEEDNTWYCPKCKEHQCASKKIEIYNPPVILIVNFKRFNNMSKLENAVKFPIEGLDIGKYVVNEDKKKESVYDLFAIGNHSGSLNFGHYYAYAKNHVKGKWYEFNDSYVSEIDNEDSLISSNAYVLFYRKRGSDTIDWDEMYVKAFKDYEGDYVSLTSNETKAKENVNTTTTTT